VAREKRGLGSFALAEPDRPLVLPHNTANIGTEAAATGYLSGKRLWNSKPMEQQTHDDP
jgi:hypothetical protein